MKEKKKSKKGLIIGIIAAVILIKFEGFTEEEAAVGVENCGANWKEQCLLKAQSYLEYQAFSKEGLADQLKYEGFSEKQINYAIEKVGY